MTKEEAKEVFLNRGYIKVDGGTLYSPDKWREACVVISEWLEQEPCNDAISRQAVKDMLDARGVKAVMTFEHFKELLDKLPPVTPQPKMGKWIRVDKDKLKCSKCEVIYFIAQYPQSANINYCPNCGCRMKGEGE